MKNIEDLIQKAVELQNNGLGTGQIADELNVSRETVTWLLTRSKKEVAAPAPKEEQLPSQRTWLDEEPTLS